MWSMMCVLRISHIPNQQSVIPKKYHWKRRRRSLEFSGTMSVTFIFNCQKIVQAARELEPTKQNVIGIVSRFYDPLGVLAPITVKLKMLFQELCQSRVGWDEELSSELKKKWEHLILDLENIESTLIPRCYRGGIEEKVISHSLQGFCDASLKAYGAVVYLKMTASLNVYKICYCWNKSFSD